MDKAVEYVQKLNAFVATLNTTLGKNTATPAMGVIPGRKFDKVCAIGSTPNQGKYMIDRNSWQIFGTKSWAQHNPRRTFGTLDSVSQYDWSGHVGVPRSGTDAERVHSANETRISSTYRKRGRPRKNP